MVLQVTTTTFLPLFLKGLIFFFCGKVSLESRENSLGSVTTVVDDKLKLIVLKMYNGGVFLLFYSLYIL